jgi:hypothetical protein
VVAFVVVAFTPVKFCKVEEPVASMVAIVANPFAVRVLKVAPLVALKAPPMVVEAVTANVPVDVAPVIVRKPPLVALRKPPMVVEPEVVRVARDDRPVTLSVPLWVVLPLVSVPKEAAVAKRLVEDETEAKRLVEVALLVVAFTPVKFCRVEEPVTRRLARVARPLVRRVLKLAPFVALKVPPMVVEPVMARVPAAKTLPTLLMVKRVEVAKLVVVEPIVKSWVVVVGREEVGVAKSER